ncbi:PREDICTED: agamous-like MADS-box protein AGL61 [Fragaria vesca subsp. vesca]|uniref:agamous-like MADS-box protein AGL61 n=1 Tax=Fragaria vesca subsp. vesca TaxID=101020 RepID=UPI0002C353B9|nr:PREDICTED: agamous-like MADS-box protein AGL61 [Fragaria vesca subsp. vesca]
MEMQIKKPRQGRQKIAITKIPNRSNLQVTFSKRCAGLFKKASELCTLCGVEIAIVVFSPSNKPFSFGHPSVKALIGRFLTPSPSSFPITIHQTLYPKKASVEHELNMQLIATEDRLEAQKRRGEDLDKMSKDSEQSSDCWWEKPIEGLGLDELQMLKVAMEELKKNVTEQVHKMNGPAIFSVPLSVMNLDHHLSERKFAEINGCHGSMIPRAYGHGSFI